MAALTREVLRQLGQSEGGWRISLFLPMHRAGAATEQDPIRLNNLLRVAEERLLAYGERPADVDALLLPGRRLVRDERFWRQQGEGLAVYLAPTGAQAYPIPFPLAEQVEVAHRFVIRPLLPVLGLDKSYTILALSQKDVRLWQGTRETLREVELRDVPHSLAEALRYDELEKERSYHTVPSGGGRGMAMYHGRGLRSDSLKDELRRFFTQVEHGVSERLQGEKTPLILAGVEYVLPIYREVNRYPHLLAGGIVGSPEMMTETELRERAWALVEPLLRAPQEAALARYAELSFTPQTSHHLETVVRAAHQGRVESLFVSLGEARYGIYDAALELVRPREAATPLTDDLLDLAATQTLAHDGAVYPLPPAAMPDGAALAAVLRY